MQNAHEYQFSVFYRKNWLLNRTVGTIHLKKSTMPLIQPYYYITESQPSKFTTAQFYPTIGTANRQLPHFGDNNTTVTTSITVTPQPTASHPSYLTLFHPNNHSTYSVFYWDLFTYTVKRQHKTKTIHQNPTDKSSRLSYLSKHVVPKLKSHPTKLDLKTGI